MNYYPPTNQIKFTTSSSLLITSYALISMTNFLLVSQHIFTTESHVSEGTKIGLFSAALGLCAINCMILLYMKSRKMPKQGVSLNVLSPRSVNFGPIVFTIFQIISMAILLALFVLSYTTIDTTTKVFIIMAQIVLNFGSILMVWSFSSTYCGAFNMMGQQGMQYGQPYGMGMGSPVGMGMGMGQVMNPNW